MSKKLSVSASILLIAFFLSGCFDANEVGNYAYVSMMGIDEGVSDILRLTFRIPEFNVASGGTKSSGGGESGNNEKEEKEVVTLDTSNLLSGVAILNNSIPKLINFMHMKAIIISEKMAESGKVGEIIGGLMRYRQVRGTTSVIICKGSAQEFIKEVKPYQGGLITEALEELTLISENTGFIPNFTLRDMYNRMKSPTTQFLGNYGAINNGENFKDSDSIYEDGYKIPGNYYAGETYVKGGPKIELFGSAVFDGDKMVGKLTGFETQITRLVQGRLKRAAFTIQDPLSPEFVIPIEVKEFEKPQVNINFSENNPKIQVRIKLEGDINSVPSQINYEKPEMNEIIERAFEKFIKGGIEQTFAKGQRLNNDIFDLGTIAIRQFLTITEWEEYKWVEKFVQAELDAQVEFTIRRTGKFLDSEPIISSEGSK